MKIQLQQLRLTGINWDDPLPNQLKINWTTFQTSFHFIQDIRIPRWIGLQSHDSFDIHAFCDASTHAYAAVLYAISTGTHRNVSTFVIAKTKVSPIKTVSVPRLELCGALLLSRLVKKLITTLNHKPSRVVAWTDSKIVLDWLKAHPSKWKSFIANRTSEILDNVNIQQWRHVPTKDNPADFATRGLKPDELRSYAMWWHGTSWLCEPETNWPAILNERIETNEETRHTLKVIIKNTIWDIFSRYSSLERLCRIVALILRFIKAVKKTVVHTGHINAQEIENATNTLLRIHQSGMFFNEYITLTRKQSISGPLSNLNLFLDEANLLRVGGRIQNSMLSFNQKHPLILSPNHKFTQLIVEHTHRITLHGQTQLVLHVLRQKYWIVRGKTLVRKIINSCVVCLRQRVKGRSQLMGQLPSPRVTPSRPFASTGVDFAGPISIKMNTLRNAKISKAYIAVFICMAVKAVHLEVASQLTSESFIAAYKRFTSRRGICKQLYSDNGTNFVGANKLLTIELKRTIANSPEVAQLLAKDGTEWHFIPPHSPHFGGLWEAAVKSMKMHLYRTMKDRVLTFEELSTLLSQIEVCLNSRPLCAASPETDEMLALTPGHLLIGDHLMTVPEAYDPNVCLTRRWKMVNQLLNTFWRQWSTNYLHRLQHRPKWLRPEPNLRIGDIVIIIQDNLPPSKWMLGKIIQTHPGADGFVRVVTVKCSTGNIKRPITKVCRLPFDNDTATNNIEAETSMRGEMLEHNPDRN